MGDVCRAFEELAQAHKITRLVVEHRVLEQTVNQADAHLHVHQELVQVRLPDRFLSPPVERIDLLVQLARKRGPHGLSRKPGGGDARADRRTKRARDDHLHGLVPPAGVARAPAGQLHEPDPEIRPGFVRPVEGQRNVHAQDPRQVIGALEVPAEQRQRGCGAAKHVRPRNRHQPRPTCRGCRRPASC